MPVRKRSIHSPEPERQHKEKMDSREVQPVAVCQTQFGPGDNQIKTPCVIFVWGSCGVPSH